MVIYQKQNLCITGDSIKDISEYHSDLESLDCIRGILDKITVKINAKIKELPDEQSFCSYSRMGKGLWFVMFANSKNKYNPYFSIYNGNTKAFSFIADIKTLSSLLNYDTEYTIYNNIENNTFNKPGFEIFAKQMQEYANLYDKSVDAKIR